MRLADNLPGGGGWRKKSAKPIFLSAAAASRWKKSATEAKGGGLGFYMAGPRHALSWGQKFEGQILTLTAKRGSANRYDCTFLKLQLQFC